MASPPTGYSYSPTALSPPYPSHSQLPPINTMTNKKRTSEGGASGPAPALKRRKASAISITSAAGGGSAHPLRQTSFPPDEVGTPFTARSPSVDFDNMSIVSGSQVSAAGPPKKKRGRKSKAEKAREQTPSVVGGRGNTAASDAGGRAGAKSATGAGGDNAEVDDEGPTQVAATASTLTKEQKQQEHNERMMLITSLTEVQFHRYENWRASGLQKASVRRLINATISQSVAENIVIGMRAISKLYMGDIIEEARRVQAEWIAKTGEKQTDLPTPPPSTAVSPSQPNAGIGPAPGQVPVPAPAPTTNGTSGGEVKDGATAETVAKDGENAENWSAPKKESPGPLRPDHLREAVRRFKMAQEGGGVGMHALWNLQQQAGMERFPPRTGGRRIFR